MLLSFLLVVMLFGCGTTDDIRMPVNENPSQGTIQTVPTDLIFTTVPKIESFLQDHKRYIYYIIADNLDTPLATIYGVWKDGKVIGFQIEIKDPKRIVVFGDNNALAFRED